MSVIKKSNWGGKRQGAGRKPKTDFESRELFKKAFDYVVTPKEWMKFVRETWESDDWNKKRFLIEQRIGKSVVFDSKEEAKTQDIVLVLGEDDYQ